jgi:hypothetical protein
VSAMHCSQSIALIVIAPACQHRQAAVSRRDEVKRNPACSEHFGTPAHVYFVAMERTTGEPTARLIS